MPMTAHYTWHVKLSRLPQWPVRASAAILQFCDSGFVVTELDRPGWVFNLQHTNKYAMTMHMLKYDCTGFVVIEEPVDV